MGVLRSLQELMQTRFQMIRQKAVLIFLALFIGWTASARASINYPVTYNDPGGVYAAYYTSITANLQAAGALWAQYLDGSGSLEVEVVITSATDRADAISVTTSFVRKNGARDVFEQGAVAELRTGSDPNGGTPDIRIRINPTYLTTLLWLDPNPTLRTDPIPDNRIDALSILTHELGHAFVFTGWMDGTTGVLPAIYMSTFDEQVHFDGTNFTFVGANASARYGGPVPITFGNANHLGNNAPLPGSDLIPDLMNGVVFNFQTRYTISALNLDIAQDAGVALKSVTSTRILKLGGSLAFGKVAKGTRKRLYLVIQNTGSSTLSISRIKFLAGFSGKFSGTIAAGSSKRVAVTFRPTKVGHYRGNLTVYSNKTGGRNTKGLTGQGK